MKNTKTNWAINQKLMVIALVAIIGFSACDNDNGVVPPPPQIDTTDLSAVILEAGKARDGVITASSASEVPEGRFWVTESEWNTFDVVYKIAAQTKANPSSQSAVDTAKTNLQAALTTFNNAKKDGSGDAITLSGTITVKNKGQIVPYVVVQAHNDDWSWNESTKVDLTEETTWKIITTPFSSSTEISFNISGYDNDKYENKLFETTVAGVTRQVFNTDVEDININAELNLITISGTLKLGNNGQAIPSVVIQVFKKDDNVNIIGTADIVNAVNNIPWSIMIPQQTADTDITFSVVGFAGPLAWEYEQLFAFWQQDFGVKVGGQDKSGIVLNFITVSGTLNLDYNGQTIPSVFIHIHRKDNPDDEFGRVRILNARNGASWSIIMLPQAVVTDVTFHIVGFPAGPEVWEDSYYLFALWEKDFGVKVGNQSKSGVALNLITISGTVNVTSVPTVVIHVFNKNNDDWDWLVNKELHSPSANSPWSIVIPAFTSDTEIRINAEGKDQNDIQLFWNDVTTKTVKNTNVSGIAVNLISLSGTITITHNGSPFPYVVIVVEKKVGEDDYEWIASTMFEAPPANTQGSIFIPAFTSDTEIRVSVAAGDDPSYLLGYWFVTTTVKDTNVTGMVIDLDITD